MKFTAKETKEFYLDFYAKDDEDDEWNIGELKNVFCGRVKVIHTKKTVCSDWETILPVIPKSKFIGWGHTGIKENCYDYVVEQLRVTGYQLKSESWKDWSKKELTLNEGIYQIYLEEDVARMKKGVQKDQFKKGVKYLKEALKKGIPVMVGVDDGYAKVNADKTTEHFITIVGMSKDNNCIHVNEPKCAVKEALKNGEIATSRYKSYLQILEGDQEHYRTENYDL